MQRRIAEQQNTMLAGKFENAEQLEKAYLELQQKMGEGVEEAEPAQRRYRKDPHYLAQAMNEYQKLASSPMKLNSSWMNSITRTCLLPAKLLKKLRI